MSLGRQIRSSTGTSDRDIPGWSIRSLGNVLRTLEGDVPGTRLGKS